ncbi:MULTISPECIES: hypothetical protein [unclassified Serratia (in: enterobacteria)]|uniref:hypothetical protein n=1 Tax=unclassified Serratia (in: enterobacteria) TaxID=2647522 RepID=UPI00307643A9
MKTLSINPFYVAASAVIDRFNARMEHTQPKYATAEMTTAANLLEQIADAARYAGDDSAAYLGLMASNWLLTGKTPKPYEMKGSGSLMPRESGH